MSAMDLQRLLYQTKCTLHVCFVTITNLYCIPTYLLWMWVILLPFRLLNHPAYWYIEGVMYRWLLSVVATWSWNSGYYIVELGDDVSTLTNDRCLFIVNHQSTADVPFLMLAFQEKPGVLDSIMWIMDRMFRYTNFGAVSVTHGDYFITQGKNARDYQMKKLRDHLINVFLGRNRRWIILFPEGGFLSKRLETSVKYAAKNNFPVLEHVTLPRIGAMEMVLKTLRPDGHYKNILDEEVPLLEGTEEEREPLKWVIDVTVAYPEVARPIDLLAICASSRPSSTTYMHYRCYPVDQVPIDSTESLRDWTYARWAEKEELLKEYYQTGKFPLVPKSQRDKGSSDSSVRTSNEVMQKGDANEDSGDCIDKTSCEKTGESDDLGKTSNNVMQNDNAGKASGDSISTISNDVVQNDNLNKSSNNVTHRLHKVQMSTGKILFLHTLFISSTLFHFFLLNRAWNYARY